MVWARLITDVCDRDSDFLSAAATVSVRPVVLAGGGGAALGAVRPRTPATAFAAAASAASGEVEAANSFPFGNGLEPSGRPAFERRLDVVHVVWHDADTCACGR
jgi:hypothetical protein